MNALDSFTRAIDNEYFDVAHEIFMRGIRTGRPIKFGTTYLINYIYYGTLEAIEFLLDCGLDTEATDSTGRTALFAAVLSGNIRKVEMLLDRGAYVNATDRFGWTALMITSDNNYEMNNIYKLLLERGTNPNIQNSMGQTALFRAVLHNNCTLTQYLLNHGADPNIQDINGQTALFNLATSYKKVIVYALLKHSANTNIRDVNGRTFWDVALKEEKMYAIELIYDRKSAIESTVPFAFEVGLIDLIMDY
jgi:ankyrin repeat protein